MNDYIRETICHSNIDIPNTKSVVFYLPSKLPQEQLKHTLPGDFRTLAFWQWKGYVASKLKVNVPVDANNQSGALTR